MAVSPQQIEALPFTVEDAKVALEDILTAFTIPENEIKMRTARESTENDMLKMMQIVFPVATQIQMDVIPKYGFPKDGEGIIRFTQMIKLYEKQDDVVRRLNAELRSIVMPQMAASEISRTSTVSTT